jgi:sugar phosphate isomerase/epimerase
LELRNNSIKNKFPFRIGTTSYIIPDDIIPNIKYLSKQVDDVEILLFESDEISNLPAKKVISEMNQIAEENNLTYNIHLPVDIALGSADKKIRKNSIQKCLRVIDLMNNVNPLAYILHLTGNPNIMGEGTTETITDWLPHMYESLFEIEQAGVNMQELCAETLSYPFHNLDNLINEFGLSVCLDVGHLLIYNYSLHQHFDKYLNKTKVIHLHGIRNGKDHNSIDNLPEEILGYIIASLKKSSMVERIVTMEIFNEKDFLNSKKALENYL